MSFKKDICKLVGESLLSKEIYEYKKAIKDDLEQMYKDEILCLRVSLKQKQDKIDELIKISKNINNGTNQVANIAESKNKKDKKEKTEEKRFDFPRNMIE